MNELLCQLFRALREQWISAKMKVWHPWKLKKKKSRGPFWSCQLNSTANSAYLAHFCGALPGLAALSSL
jgi:hypothetical protein